MREGSVKGPQTATGIHARAVAAQCRLENVRLGSRSSARQSAALLDELHDRADAVAGPHVSEYERPCAAHARGIALHHSKRGAHMWSEIDLVDDEKIGPRNAGAALGRNLVAGRDVDHVDGKVGELWREGRCQVVAAGFDQDEIKARKFRTHVCNGGKIYRGIFADGGVRAAAGFDPGDAL